MEDDLINDFSGASATIAGGGSEFALILTPYILGRSTRYVNLSSPDGLISSPKWTIDDSGVRVGAGIKGLVLSIS